MANGDAALLHGGRGKRGEADNVTCGINIGNRCAIVFVHREVAAIIEGKTRFFEGETVHGGTAAGGEKSRLGLENFAAFHDEADAHGRGFRLCRPFAEPEMTAERRAEIAEPIGNLVVEERKEAVAAINESDVHAKSHEDGSVFAANDAAADHGKTFGDAVHLEKGVGVEGADVVESNLGGAMWLGA